MTASTSEPPSRGQSLLLVGLIFVVALAVRLAVFHQIRDNPLYQFLTLDERGNHEFALAVLHGQVPAASYYKAPLYGYFLAGLYAVLGEASIRVRLVQCILAASAPVLTALVARRLFGGVVGLVAGLWAAVFWTFVFFSTELLDTSPACVLYLLLAYGLVAWDDRRWTKWLICGAVLGLGAITRPNILAFAPVLAVIAFVVVRRRERRETEARSGGNVPSPWTGLGRAVCCTAALTIGCCATVLPVTIRNRIVGGEWVLLGAYGGMNLYVANNPYSDSKDGPLLVDEDTFLPNTTWDPNEPWARCCLNFKNAYRLAEGRLGRKPRRGEFSSILAGMGFAYIADHPGWFARHALRRLCWLFNAYEFPSNKDLYHFLRYSPLLKVLSYLHYGWLAPLGLIGLVLALTDRSLRGPPLACTVALLASLALPAVLFIINSRFRLPMVHVLVIFAAYGLVTLVRMVKHRAERRKALIVVPVLAGLAVFCNLDVFGYRKEHQPYLRFAHAVACMMSGQDDLLDEAVAHFERDLAVDLAELERENRRSNTTLLLDHCTPMRLLLPYYLRRGDRVGALRAAERMLQREPVDGPRAAQLFDVFYEAGRKHDAERALSILERQEAVPPELMAVRLLQFGARWSDRPALRRARTLYKTLTRLSPGEPRFREGLDRAEGLLRHDHARGAAATVPSPPKER